MSKITIDTNKLSKLVQKADEIFLAPEAEENLITLLEAQELIENLITEAQKKLEEAGLKANLNFSSIQSDAIKVYYRAYGAQFYLDEAQINLAPKELYTVESKVTYKIDSDGVKKWVDKFKGMPAGIVEVPIEKRPKQLKFKLKHKK